MRIMMKRNKEMTNHDKLLVLWCLAKRNEIMDKYRKAIRQYCLTCENWDEVQAIRNEAHHNGISDEVLLDIDLDVQNGVTDEELLQALY